MCTVSINIDEAAMLRIDPRLTSQESIGRWLQHQVELMIEEMSHDMTVENKVRDVMAESRRQALKRDMTPEQLYSVISEEIDEIYANSLTPYRVTPSPSWMKDIWQKVPASAGTFFCVFSHAYE